MRSISQYSVQQFIFLRNVLSHFIISLEHNLNRVFFRVQVTVIPQKTFSMGTPWLPVLYNYESHFFIFCITKCLPKYLAILQLGHLSTTFTWTRAFTFFWSWSTARNTLHTATQHRDAHATLKSDKVRLIFTSWDALSDFIPWPTDFQNHCTRRWKTMSLHNY